MTAEIVIKIYKEFLKLTKTNVTPTYNDIFSRGIFLYLKTTAHGYFEVLDSIITSFDSVEFNFVGSVFQFSEITKELMNNKELWTLKNVTDDTEYYDYTNNPNKIRFIERFPKSNIYLIEKITTYGDIIDETYSISTTENLLVRFEHKMIRKEFQENINNGIYKK